MQVHPAGPNSIMAAVQGPEEDIRCASLEISSADFGFTAGRSSELAKGLSRRQVPRSTLYGCLVADLSLDFQVETGRIFH